MHPERKEPAVEKQLLHPRNKHRVRYDFKTLVKHCAALSPFVIINKFGDTSIDFFNADAVKTLNKALLKYYYKIEYWKIPAGYLCPPIPGRADYIHYIADLLAENNNGIIPTGSNVKCLDIGVGANCVYPVIGHQEYGWSFVGSDINVVSIEIASKIITSNAALKGQIEVRLQTNPNDIFTGIIKTNEQFDITICNPPFHASAAEAQAGTMRKLKNLTHKKTSIPALNFGGQHNELWCDGGEAAFIQKMILESKQYADSCFWFTSLISKEATLKSAYKTLEKINATVIKTIPMSQGNKTSRILAWTFLTKQAQKNWIERRFVYSSL